MTLIAAALSGFVLASVAPWVHRLARRNTGWLLASFALGLTLYFGSYIPHVSGGGVVQVTRSWIPSLGINLSFYLDGLSLLFALLITGIGALVLLYSGGYLAGHPQLGRFYMYILLFMASMLGVVLADDALTMFVFWELTSVSSYLLIGFNHAEGRSRTAALQALLVTSLGGLSLLAGLLLLGQAAGSFQLSELIGRGQLVAAHPRYLPILLLILGGAFTKSAQFPFHFWLPAAMEAPTPVSAYLHSATMVKAGVYLLARLSPVLGDTTAWLYIIGTVGGVTAVLGAYLALRQTDLKLILAYSTVSALGLLCMLLGMGDAAVEAAIIYLLAHALYKGALFLAAGAVEHETGTRNVTELGGLWRAMPLTATAAGLAALSMAGLPPLAGFLSKEMLYQAVSRGDSWVAPTAAAVLASILLVPAAILVGIKPFSGQLAQATRKSHEAPIALWLGPLTLAVFGLLLALLPGGIANAVLSPALAAIHQEPLEVHVQLWHGFNFVLALSAVTLAGGLVVYRWWKQFRSLNTRLEPVFAWGPTRWYFKLLEFLNSAAAIQTRLFQSGYLRFYVMATLLTTLLLAAYPLLVQSWVLWRPSGTGVRFYEAGLGVLILLGAVTAVKTQSFLAAITALGVVGFGVALLFVLFGAPDLAMTQFVVESLIVIFFVLVTHRMPKYTVISSRAVQLRDGLISLAAGVVMTALVLAASVVPLDPQVAAFYARSSVPLAHGRNIVNVILVDFRGLDTLGEITVLAIAAVGVYALLKLRPSRQEP